MLDYAGILLIAFILALALGLLLIPLLRRLKIGQSIRAAGPKSHLKKAGVPTMGGVIFLLAAVAALALFVPARNPQGYLALGTALAFGAIGFADDYLKVVLKRPLGLKARYKLAGQIAISVAFYLVLRALGLCGSLVLPGLGFIELGWAYPIFATIVLVGTANAVNLADGLDGLAGGLSAITLLGAWAICWLSGRSGLAYIPAALAGGVLGYLVFNLHPAKVIMGDTGSLALGGAIGALALLTGTELLLLLGLGIIFVLETVSVIIQVSYFKMTGRRVFLMAPIHHHFELKGWSEWKVCSVFWLVQLIGTLAALTVWRGTH